MDQIIPGLWIGDLACALATDYLSMAGITHIVTAMKQRIPSPIKLPDGRTIEEDHIYHVNLDDVEDALILVHFPGAIEFIDHALQQTWIEDEETEKENEEDCLRQQERDSNSRTTPPTGKRAGQWATMGEGTVLVHCHAGISRSVAIVIAYLMHTRKISLPSALNLVRKRRSIADPNKGFIHQLELYQSGGFQVDVRNQRIRRFLMSQFSILRGDPIDDVLLSYYPSPFHSPTNSQSSTGSFQWAGSSTNNNPGGMAGMGLQFSKLEMDQANTAERKSSNSPSGSDHSPTSSGRNSVSMSRQNSRIAASSAAAKGAHVRMQRRASRSSEDGSPVGLTELSKEATGSIAVENVIDLSVSPPMPPMSQSLFDEDDEESHKRMREEEVNQLIREKFTSISEPNEVMVTVNSGKLPGGVTKVRGNQVRNPSSSSIRQAQRLSPPGQQSKQTTLLPKPYFTGMKLRCKKCRRELAAQDHVVEHEPGKGKDAFDVRKRAKDVEQQSRDNRETIGDRKPELNVNPNPMTLEQKFGSQSGQSDTEKEQSSLEKDKEKDEQEQKPASEPIQTPAPSFKSAASLSAQLPPHLAALRQGLPKPNQTNGIGGGSNLNTNPTTNNNVDLRKMLHSPLCSAYFVEPLAWMSVLRSGEIAGRLDCPGKRCGAKLGNWDWAGMQCACGAWVTPAFALHRSKVDEI